MSARKKVLRQGRWVTESGESTLDSDLEAAQTKALNSFKPNSSVDEALKQARELQEKIRLKREKLGNAKI